MRALPHSNFPRQQCAGSGEELNSFNHRREMEICSPPFMLSCCFAHMTISTTAFAFNQFFFYNFPSVTGHNQLSHFCLFTAPHMITLKYNRVSFPTINARMLVQIVHQAHHIFARYPASICIAFSNYMTFIAVIVFSRIAHIAKFTQTVSYALAFCLPAKIFK